MYVGCLMLPGQVDENTSTVMLDTSGGAWITPTPGTLSGEDVTRRCRHAVTSVGPFVFIYGGLKGSTLLDDLLLAGTFCAVHMLALQACRQQCQLELNMSFHLHVYHQCCSFHLECCSTWNVA